MSSSINQPIHLYLPSIASPSVHIASCLVFSDVQNDFYAALLCNVGAFFLSCFPSFSLLICHPSNSFQPLCLSSNCFAHILSLLISFFSFLLLPIRFPFPFPLTPCSILLLRPSESLSSFSNRQHQLNCILNHYPCTMYTEYLNFLFEYRIRNLNQTTLSASLYHIT